MPVSRLRSSSRIAGSTRFDVMSPTPTTSQFTIPLFYSESWHAGEPKTSRASYHEAQYAALTGTSLARLFHIKSSEFSNPVSRTYRRLNDSVLHFYFLA